MNPTNSRDFARRCETLGDFVVSVDSFVESASKQEQFDTKTLFSFLEANDEYLNHTLKETTTKKLSELAQKASSTVDKDSSQYKTLNKIKHLTNRIGSDDITVKLDGELRKLFGNEIQKAINLLRHDRFINDVQLAEFLKKSIGDLPTVNEALIKKDPLLAMFILILNNNPREDHLRDLAADRYILQYPEDERFEKAYIYLKTPNILIGHLLICSDNWSSANPENKAFYDEQMAGMFHGNIAFDKGDRLSFEEVTLIQKCEGENPRFPIINKLEKKEGYFEVKDWCTTPAMCSSDTRLDDLFITSRRVAQESTLVGFVGLLEETSKIVQRVYKLSPDESAAVAIIGPYGAGKSHYVRQKFSGEKPITVFSLDRLNQLLMNPTSRRQDHHFEAMMLTGKLLKQLAEIPVLLTETAAIDEFRFNRLVDRDFSARHRIIIEEIAPENTTDSIKRFAAREGNKVSSNQSHMGAVTTSTNDALRFRAGRIESAKMNPKVDYTLYCNISAANGDAVFAEIAKAKGGVLTVQEDRKETFSLLTPEAKK